MKLKGPSALMRHNPSKQKIKNKDTDQREADFVNNRETATVEATVEATVQVTLEEAGITGCPWLAWVVGLPLGIIMPFLRLIKQSQCRNTCDPGPLCWGQACL
jgi:hypothetical protein